MISGYNAVKILSVEKPNWLPMVKASLELAKENGEFAGSWVLNRLKEIGINWFPGLRTLTAYKILERIDTSRGGRRAYYKMLDPDGVEKALKEIETKNIKNKKLS